MEVRVAAADADLAGATLIAAVMDGLAAAPGSADALAAVDERAVEAAGFVGRAGQFLLLPHDEAAALLLAGVGDEISFDGLRAVSGDAVRKVRTERAVTLLAQVGVEDATRAVTEGSILGGYEFRAYKTGDEGLDAEVVEVVGADEASLVAAAVVSEAVAFARDLVNTPAKDQAPETLAAVIGEAASEAGLTVEIWDKARIEGERLGALLGVAAGSERDPRVVVLRHRPAGAERRLALVGKGVVFDTGGLSLKTAALMEEMKDDMSGAAVASAAAIAVARLGLPVDVTCIVPLTDNAVGGGATRPGDVLRPVDGPTIEVLNTDAEGRLILADALGLARACDPDLIIDVATLTGAARVALGDKIAAVFGSGPDVAAQVLEAASIAGEPFWEMPLHKEYRKSLDSDIADIKNISGRRYGGAVVAALFLAEYAGDGPWAHLDIAGPARARETSGDQVKGASGVGVRTLVEVARGMARTDR